MYITITAIIQSMDNDSDFPKPWSMVRFLVCAVCWHPNQYFMRKDCEKWKHDDTRVLSSSSLPPSLPFCCFHPPLLPRPCSQPFDFIPFKVCVCTCMHSRHFSLSVLTRFVINININICIFHSALTHIFVYTHMYMSHTSSSPSFQ